MSILEFGIVGDGKTLNTVAFQKCHLIKSFADKGGAYLYVPLGKWLTSNLTLFLERGATILGSQMPVRKLFPVHIHIFEPWKEAPNFA